MIRLATLLAGWVVSAGCSTTAPVGGCPPYVSTADLTTPARSFARDVAPIFRGSCAVSAECHGDPSTVAEYRPFLGYPDSGSGSATSAQILGGLVGVASGEDLGMSLIAAGDPANSFLVHKIDGDQCTLQAQCMVGGSFRPNCGDFMPYQAPELLDPDVRDVIRAWIAQGAADN